MTTEENKKNVSKMLPSIEIMIIGIFFISFVFMMLPRCESKQVELSAIADNKVSKSSKITLDSVLEKPKPKPLKAPSLKQTSPAIVTKRTVLYVTIDGMNLRDKPTLKSGIIQKLPLYEQVYFMDETSEFTQKLDLFEGVTTDEPWIKVQTKEGKTGWLYGAGVHFYRKKFEQEKSVTEKKE
ncbi:MAG: SH3 domain-containing protein [Bacteroidota bacterium]